MTQTRAAAVFGVTGQAVGKWMKAWRTGGGAALAARKRGPKGPRGKLRGWQAAKVCNLIRDRHPEQLKLPFYLWTSGTGQRFGANVFSALTNRGQLSFMVFKSRFTAAVFLRFLRRLVKDARRKVFLVVDRHPVHRTRAVRGWLRRNTQRIEMFLLPGYSPELNPDEMLNQDVKTNAVGKRRPLTRPQRMRTVRGYLERRRRNPELVQRYFHEPSVRYAAA